jgi:ATPase subunit of ABC transporter with duplicated ATPase domains
LLRAESSLHVGPDPEAQRKVRELTDDLAVSRSEQDHQAQAARAAREVVAAAEARSLAAEDEATAAEARAAVTAALAAEAEARAAAAEARAAAAAAEAASLAGRAAAAEAELAAVLATRTFRWSSGLRTTYGRFRGGNP